MKGYVSTIGSFITTPTKTIVDDLITLHPDASESLAKSWVYLIEKLKNHPSIRDLNPEIIIGIEYTLPVNSMGVDLFLYGHKQKWDVMLIIESKRWSDSFIKKNTYSEFRSDKETLYPQVQIYRQKIAIKHYLDIGQDIDAIIPGVYLDNNGGPIPEEIFVPDTNIASSITITSDFGRIMRYAEDMGPGRLKSDDFQNATYCPSRDIIEAMDSIASKEEPFVLTEEQEKDLAEIEAALQSGKNIIHIFGSAGSGKTAILLNLYVRLLKKRDITGITPYFSSGGQNTNLYRSLYPQVKFNFSMTYTLRNDINSNNGPKSILLLDEAQSNENGMILSFVNKGATVVFCHDSNQIVNLNNSVSELSELTKRDDYFFIVLRNSVRFNGSQLFESNVKKLLNENKKPVSDDNYYFKVVSDMDSLKEEIQYLRHTYPASTLSISGLLSADAPDIVRQSNGLFFVRWGYKTETQWVPYVRRCNYESEFGGSYWLGTWWSPGLDVDYNVVVVGGDAIMTKNGLIGDASPSKLYKAVESVLQRVDVPQSDRSRACSSYSSFIDYCNHGHDDCKKSFDNMFNELIRNYYYITLTRGKKGCVVYFTRTECD